MNADHKSIEDWMNDVSRGVVRLPSFQRDETWNHSLVSSFIEAILQQRPLGVFLVLRVDPDNQPFLTRPVADSVNNGEKCREHLLDGQQRLTTVVLLLMCARNFFANKKEKSEKAKRYFERLGEYIKRGKQKTPVLVLSRTNDQLFKEISGFDDHEQTQADTHSKSNDSNELLANAYKIIQRWVDERSEGDAEAAIELIYSYVQILLNKFVIYKYRYKKEADAYTVFNLVNNRGTGLNESDLIKNSLFGEMAANGTGEKELDEFDELWDKIRHNVTSKKKIRIST